jgi:hypothetical protein
MCDIKETRHLWYLKNRERIIEHQKTYRKDKINNDYKFRLSVVNYQARYYQKRKMNKKKDILQIKKTINIDVANTTVIF